MESIKTLELFKQKGVFFFQNLNKINKLLARLTKGKKGRVDTSIHSQNEISLHLPQALKG